MISIADNPAARQAINNFMVSHADALPGDVLDQFLKLASEVSIVTQTVRIAELLYARSAEIESEARELAGGLASYASENGWCDMQVEGRGNRIALAMRRENGETAPEGSTFPDPETDPAPLPEYAPSGDEA